MTSVPGRAVVALLLVLAAAAFWKVGQWERRLADTHQALATLRYAAPAAEYDDIERSLRYAGRLPGPGSAMLSDARTQRATAQYWLSEYASLVPQRDASGALVDRDPGLLLLAANAAYRSSQADTSDRLLTIHRLESVMKAYAEVLKNNPGDADAAYNFEYVVRKRNLLIQPHPATPKADAPAAIHGRPGAPPPGTDMSRFKMVIPKRDEERNDPTAGKGGVKTRKG